MVINYTALHIQMLCHGFHTTYWKAYGKIRITVCMHMVGIPFRLNDLDECIGIYRSTIFDVRLNLLTTILSLSPIDIWYMR